MRSFLTGVSQKIKAAFQDSKDGPKVFHSRDARFELEAEHLERDGEAHVFIHAQHVELTWCKAALRFILRPSQDFELQSSFSIDWLAYALEVDFEPQTRAVEALVEACETVLPDLDAKTFLMEQLKACFDRIRARWAENEAAGYQVERFSVYGSTRPNLVLAAPSTAMGRTKIVGAQDRRGQGKFESYRGFHDHIKHLKPVSQEVLADNTKMSGHEKLEILSGKATNLLKEAKEVFNEERLRQPYRHEKCLGFPGLGAIAILDDRSGDSWGCNLTLETGDEVYVRAWGTNEKNQRGTTPERLELSTKLAAQNQSLSFDWKREKRSFSVKGGGPKERFPSIEEMEFCFRSLINRIIELDPEWPQWVAEKCVAEFDTAHPILREIKVPPRHQRVIAKILEDGFEQQTKLTKRFMAKNTHAAEKEAGLADTPNEMPDGMVFGDIKTEGLKFWEEAKIIGNARVFSAQTISEKDAKRRKRALVPLYGADNNRAFTPKQIARLTPYTEPDALKLFPQNFLGDDKRELFEAAYRVALELSGTTENPVLQGEETISHIETGEEGVDVRWTEVDGVEGYALSAFTTIVTVPGRWRAVQHSGAAFSVLTTPNGQQTYLRPSFIGQQSHLPERELQWLKDAIDGSFPFEPERAVALITELEREWSKQRDVYPDEISSEDLS